MDLKVYDGYKSTSTKRKSTVSKSVNDNTENISLENLTETEPSKAPNRTPNAKLANKIASSKPRIALFIDVDNVGISRENLLEILFFANGKFQIELCKLYGFSEDTLPGIREIATAYNVSTVGKMKFKPTGANCLDSRLLIDAYECAINNRQKVDMIFVWCYPCDLSNLFEKIVALGVNTATIENSIFDCKNKFVSQTFKLYSPYNFNFEQTTYGQIQNEPSNITPREKIEPTDKKTPDETQTINTDTALSTNEISTTTQPEMIDSVVPPILPRRSIPERSNPSSQKQQSIDDNNVDNQETSEQPSNLVEEIARKLNIPMPTNDEISHEMEKFETTSNQNSSLFMEMLKQAGFDDLINEKKELKYEDTIGDL